MPGGWLPALLERPVPNPDGCGPAVLHASEECICEAGQSGIDPMMICRPWYGDVSFG